VRYLWVICALSAFLAIPLAGCEVADGTAEAACDNATCPPGTAMEMNAQSTGSCSGSMEFSGDQSVTGGSAAGAASGSCYASGSCVYACFVTTVCCGESTWTTESYNCSQDCVSACGNGECEAGEDATECPADCATYCGDDTCDYNEVCFCCDPEKSEDCDPEEAEACEACGNDCCPQCGDDVCEWPEAGGPGVPNGALCSNDCGGDACIPTCDLPKPACGYDDGCGTGTLCNTCNKAGSECLDGACQPAGSTRDNSCQATVDCPDGGPALQCVDGECELCPDDCSSQPCNAPGCGGCGICAQEKICKDNGQCQ
jgi:hypothetical protein